MSGRDVRESETHVRDERDRQAEDDESAVPRQRGLDRTVTPRSAVQAQFGKITGRTVSVV